MNRLVSIRSCLDDFQQAGVLELADVHTASRVCRLAGETDENAMLAVALTVRAVRHGSVCLEVDRFTEVDVEPDPSGDATPEGLVATRCWMRCGEVRWWWVVLPDLFVHCDSSTAKPARCCISIGISCRRT